MTSIPQTHWDNLPADYKANVLNEWENNSSIVGFDIQDVLFEEWFNSAPGDDYYMIAKDFEYASGELKRLSEQFDDYQHDVHDMTMTPSQLLNEYKSLMNGLEDTMRKLQPNKLETFVQRYPELSI